jgi:hypothetical protein
MRPAVGVRQKMRQNLSRANNAQWNTLCLNTSALCLLRPPHKYAGSVCNNLVMVMTSRKEMQCHSRQSYGKTDICFPLSALTSIQTKLDKYATISPLKSSQLIDKINIQRDIV